MRALFICLLLTQTAAVSRIPDKPDFSGTWVLVATDPADADAAKALTVSQSVRGTNGRGEPVTPYYDQITIARESANGTTYETFHIGLVGGAVSGVGDITTARRATHRAVVWDRADPTSLVFEFGTYSGLSPGTGDWTERRETWTLERDGALKMTIATSGSADSPRTITSTYRLRR